MIGSGPAGITTAVELAKANRRVLVFESGTATEARTDMVNAVNYGHFRDNWWDRHSVRVLGGTSRVWTGWCTTLMERDFNNPAAGVRWPITKSTLAPYYQRAAAILDRKPAMLDVERRWMQRFLYRPYSRERATRFGTKYFDVLETSPMRWWRTMSRRRRTDCSVAAFSVTGEHAIIRWSSTCPGSTGSRSTTTGPCCAQRCCHLPATVWF